MKTSRPAAQSDLNSPERGYCPDQGDIVWLDFDPQAGREQRGRRPALVLSPRIYNARSGLCVLCPSTSQVKGYPFEQLLPDGLAVSGAVLSDQVKSLSWQFRRAEFACAAPAPVVAHVRAKISALIRLP
jgi:mRNA interferase MazF